jgi:hypothetical protein
MARLTAKVVTYTCGHMLNAQFGRPLRHLTDHLT